MNQIKIKGTFLDEISHDIPHQNWSEKEWDNDFFHMKRAGINKVILIRSGYRNWVTYPSKVLKLEQNVINPDVDLVSLFLKLSEKHNFDFFFGLYDSGKYWNEGKYIQEINLNKKVIEEVWENYGNSSSFKGWYISQECNKNISGIIDIYGDLGNHCKKISNNLPVLILSLIHI